MIYALQRIRSALQAVSLSIYLLYILLPMNIMYSWRHLMAPRSNPAGAFLHRGDHLIPIYESMRHSGDLAVRELPIKVKHRPTPGHLLGFVV